MKRKKIPMRKCIACQEMKSKKELLRIVRTPEMKIVLDTNGKKPGRGAYICYQKECFQLAKKKRSMEKALETKISEEIYQQLEIELEQSNGQ